MGHQDSGQLCGKYSHNARSKGAGFIRELTYLTKLPGSIQSKAKSMIHDMYTSGTEKSAMKACNHFRKVYEGKFPEAVARLKKGEDNLFTLYDFPAAHWIHMRSTTAIESTFTAVRLRTKRTRGCGSRTATLTMVFKLASEAQKRWKN